MRRGNDSPQILALGRGSSQDHWAIVASDALLFALTKFISEEPEQRVHGDGCSHK